MSLLLSIHTLGKGGERVRGNEGKGGEVRGRVRGVSVVVCLKVDVKFVLGRGESEGGEVRGGERQ